MNIYNYIDEYGMHTFEEKDINEIDCVIFSFLSYADFTNILEEDKPITIQDAARRYVGLYPKKDDNVIAVREADKILKYLKDTNRYKNCKLYNYEYIGNDDVQFGAITIEYKKNYIYISYEGTNELFSGWKENFMLSYQFPTLSHEMAISYLNRHFTFSTKRIIVGGHSKGGNLALVAGMYANILVRKKIKKIYNVDGPGLLDKGFNSKQFTNIKSKYIHIIPNYSLVGLLLNNTNNKVVESSNKTILAHNIIYWQINKTTFNKTKLSTMSKELDKEIKKWHKKYSQEDENYFIVFINNLDKILKQAKVKSILDLKEEKTKIFKLIYESRELDPKTKELLKEFLQLVIKCFNNTKKEEIKSFLSTVLKTHKKEEVKE